MGNRWQQDNKSEGIATGENMFYLVLQNMKRNSSGIANQAGCHGLSERIFCTASLSDGHAYMRVKIYILFFSVCEDHCEHDKTDKQQIW